jgi:hypothetical protein
MTKLDAVLRPTTNLRNSPTHTFLAIGPSTMRERQCAQLVFHPSEVTSSFLPTSPCITAPFWAIDLY